MSKILIVGDVMIDRYIWGLCKGTSPDAPILHFDVTEQEDRLGGAGNVVQNVCALAEKEHTVHFFGNIGFDVHGLAYKYNLAKNVFRYSFVRSDTTTEIKTRVVTKEPYAQMIRFDQTGSRPTKKDLKDLVDEIFTATGGYINTYDVGIVSDYAHGAITPEIFLAARKACKTLVVDPKQQPELYIGCDFITPNRYEFKDFGYSSSSIDQLASLSLRLGGSSVVLKQGEEGCSFYTPLMEKDEHLLPYRTGDKIVDPMGAGDTFISTLAVALAQGETTNSSVRLANTLAGMSVMYPGCWCPDKTLDQIKEEYCLLQK